MKIYVSTHVKKDIRPLKSIFDKLETPMVPIPIKPADKIIYSEDVTIKTVTHSKKDELIYESEIKSWIKEKRNLETVYASL